MINVKSYNQKDSERRKQNHRRKDLKSAQFDIEDFNIELYRKYTTRVREWMLAMRALWKLEFQPPYSSEFHIEDFKVERQTLEFQYPFHKSPRILHRRFRCCAPYKWNQGFQGPYSSEFHIEDFDIELYRNIQRASENGNRNSDIHSRKAQNSTSKIPLTLAGIPAKSVSKIWMQDILISVVWMSNILYNPTQEIIE